MNIRVGCSWRLARPRLCRNSKATRSSPSWLSCPGSEFVERHYLSKRRRRQKTILVFLAQAADSQVVCFSCADVTKNRKPDQVLRSVKFWKRQADRLHDEMLISAHRISLGPDERAWTCCKTLIIKEILTFHNCRVLLGRDDWTGLRIPATAAGSSIKKGLFNCGGIISVYSQFY